MSLASALVLAQLLEPAFLLAGVSSVLVLDRDEDCLKKSDIFRFDIFFWRGKVTFALPVHILALSLSETFTQSISFHDVNKTNEAIGYWL